MKLTFRQLLTQRLPRKSKKLQRQPKKVTYTLSGMGGGEWLDCFVDITTDLAVDRTGNPWNTMTEHNLEYIIDTAVDTVVHGMRATISEIDTLIQTNIHTHSQGGSETCS